MFLYSRVNSWNEAMFRWLAMFKQGVGSKLGAFLSAVFQLANSRVSSLS